jgi:pSer/pThr/pTyr-binding forkhead associated (FHA) protein
VIDSISVSRCHAVLLQDAAGVRLIDLESTNGTLVNGVPAQPDQPVRLINGNIIQLGYVWARYCAPYRSSV